MQKLSDIGCHLEKNMCVFIEDAQPEIMRIQMRQHVYAEG
jgi:hypothetical protein